jgi:hypothetical protein
VLLCWAIVIDDWAYIISPASSIASEEKRGHHLAALTCTFPLQIISNITNAVLPLYSFVSIEAPN